MSTIWPPLVTSQMSMRTALVAVEAKVYLTFVAAAAVKATFVIVPKKSCRYCTNMILFLNKNLLFLCLMIMKMNSSKRNVDISVMDLN